jgi:kumamolisin
VIMSDNYGEYVSLTGSQRMPLHGASIIGPSNPNERIRVTVTVRGKNEDEKLKLSEKMLKIPPRDRQYLSPEEFGAKFGADTEDIDKVKTFAQKNGLKVEEVRTTERTLTLSGTVQSFSQAFKVKLDRYGHPGGEYRGRVGEIKIPSELKDIITGVFGLDNRRQLYPCLRLQKDISADGAANIQSYFANEVGQLYNFPKDLDGSGQCIGILEFGGGYTDEDLKKYFSKLEIESPNVSSVSVDDTTNQPGKYPEVDMEVALDIEVAGTIAPKAKIVVYFASPSSDDGMVNALKRAVFDPTNNPSVISISYSGAEKYWTNQLVAKINEVCYEAATHRGITICASTGDNGSSEEHDNPATNTIPDDLAHAAFPASNPNVLACGGTNLQTTSNDAMIDEVVWNDNTPFKDGGVTGGGISDIYGIPDYQENINLPSSINPGGRRGRGIPDISGHASEDRGYWIIVAGKSTAVGGTSAATPLWAGLIALLNQGVARRLGFIHNLLYSKVASAGALRDIVSGDNSITKNVDNIGSVRIKGYAAQIGWDACTGLGRPDGTKLLEIIKNS